MLYDLQLTIRDNFISNDKTYRMKSVQQCIQIVYENFVRKSKIDSNDINVIIQVISIIPPSSFIYLISHRIVYGP